jgi:hypothetical protein
MTLLRDLVILLKITHPQRKEDEDHLNDSINPKNPKPQTPTLVGVRRLDF